jgi:hypothetical protein
MPYSAVEDVPGVEVRSVDANDLDAMLYSALEAVRFALRQRGNFKRALRSESELISILRSQLLLYETTHKSIRVILARAYESDNFSLIPDATSLVREQVEKLFIVALFLDNPQRWLLRYARTAWRDDYERFRLETEEYGAIDRHQEFLTKHFPETLHRMKRITIGSKTETIVSEFAIRALQHRWDIPGDERPSWFVKAQRKKKRKFNRLRDYIRDYFDFPTPGRAAATITNLPLRQFLFRWHKDYSAICQYSHALFGKIIIPTMCEFKDSAHADKTEYAGKRLAEQTIYWSLLSAATSCALIVRAIKSSLGSEQEVKDFWKVLYGSSLAGKGYWEMYIKGVLK